MTQTHRSRALVLLAVLGVPAVGLAHEDDPKILHRKPAYQGPGYSTGAFGRGGGFTVGGTTFAASNVTLLSWMPLSEFGNPSSGSDCWGYTSPSGREYALFTDSNRTNFVEITNPGDPVLIDSINGPDSLWRDVKVYQNHCYIVSEGGNGIQVVNMANIDNGSVSLVNTITSGGTSATHNVAIDEVSGYLYRCGGGDEGIRFYSLSNPSSPAYQGEWSTRYVHDAQIKTFTSGPYSGRQIAFNCSGFNGGFTDTGLTIVDVTTKSNPIVRGQVSWPGAEYSHQCWLSEDGETLYVNDELDENGSFPTTTYIINVSNIDNPQYVGSFTNGNSAVGHNLYVKGDLIYEANYTSGLRVFDASNPFSPFETAWLDTAPGGDGASFNGLWSVYPYFDSGVVIGSDLERGLFTMWVGSPLISFSFPAGQPELLDPDGESFTVQLNELDPGSYVPGTAKLFYDAGQGTVEVALADLGGGNFSADFAPTPCGTTVQYYFSAESTNGLTWVDPPNGGFYQAASALSKTEIFADSFESFQAWSVGAAGDDASTGVWVRTNPIGTSAQPEDDNTDPGSLCYFTGQGSPGGSLGENDVDGGKTTLTSPTLNLSSNPDAKISYYRWYSNTTGGSPEADVFVVDVSSNGGGSWTNVETVGPGGPEVQGGWIYHEFRVADFVTPTNNVRVRFVASDEGDGSIVEAAIDDFQVSETECPDCNGNGVADGQDILSGTSLDLDQDATPDECQPFSADSGTLSSFLGGTVNFALDGGAALGGQLYLVVGSLSGDDPGFTVGSVQVPLNQDVYFDYSVANANSAPLVNTFAFLDPAGQGSASFALSPGFTNLIGLQAHHAWMGIDPVTLAVTFGSNAMPLTFGF
ncbi:MAG: choice-of-anchor B family protein [Planctomycetota bacterium]